MGCDGISPKLLKHCAVPLCQPLHHLFHLSLSQHYIPLDWRTHLVKPVLKSGNSSSVKNYRPISLLCIVSKILEKIVHKYVMGFVERLITPSQFGFLKGHSTLQQLLILCDTMINNSHGMSQTDVVYLDFRKAFDSVAHNELLYKQILQPAHAWCTV